MQYRTRIIRKADVPKDKSWDEPIDAVCNSEAASGWSLHSVTPIITGGNFSGSTTDGFALVFQK
jgi:hypothetical protein